MEAVLSVSRRPVRDLLILALGSLRSGHVPARETAGALSSTVAATIVEQAGTPVFATVAEPMSRPGSSRWTGRSPS